MFFRKKREIERLKRELSEVKSLNWLLNTEREVIRPPYHKEPLKKVELYASVPTSASFRTMREMPLVEAFRKELNNYDLDFETVGFFDGPTMFDQATLTIYMEVDNG